MNTLQLPRLIALQCEKCGRACQLEAELQQAREDHGGTHAGEIAYFLGGAEPLHCPYCQGNYHLKAHMPPGSVPLARSLLLSYRERDEMSRLLSYNGYEGALSEELQADGIGPCELRHRLSLPPDAGGLLESHGFAPEGEESK